MGAADPSVVTAIATVTAAVITGLGAASLKQLWDSRRDRSYRTAEEARWRRSERLDAVSAYLSARPTLADVIRQRASGSPEIEQETLRRGFRLAYTKLTILLTEEQDRRVIDDDRTKVEAWLREATESGPGWQLPAPVEDSVVELARDIIGRGAVDHGR